MFTNHAEPDLGIGGIQPKAAPGDNVINGQYCGDSAWLVHIAIDHAVGELPCLPVLLGYHHLTTLDWT
jgi:hypothetical protein